MSEALDLTPLDDAMDDLADTFDGDEMLGMLMAAAEPMKDQWRANIIAAGEVGDPPFHYADSLVIAPVYRKKVIATAEIAAAMDPDREKPADRAYPAILEYGDATIVPRPVALRAFDQTRREVVSAIAALSGRKATSRRVRTRTTARSQVSTNKSGGGGILADLLGAFR